MTLLAALAGALAISFSAIFYELAEVSPATGAFFRCLFALPALLLIWWPRRRLDRRSSRMRWLAAFAGLLLGVDMIAWHVSIEYIGAGLSTLIANSQVIIVAIAAWILLGEKPSRRLRVGIPVVLVGVALVTGLGRGDSFGSNPLLGALLALVSATFYAGFILAIRKSNDVMAPSAGPNMDSTASGILAIALLAPLGGGIDPTPGAPALMWLLALALVSQVAGWILIGYALPRLPAAETATIILLQPVLTMIWAAILFSERPSTLQLVGAGLVLAGVGYVATGSARRELVPQS